MRHSLTARLVAIAVALVAVVCVLIGTVTAVAMRQSLMSRLDNDVRALSHGGPDDLNRGAPHTLLVVRPSPESAQPTQGVVLGAYPGASSAPVSQAALTMLAAIQPGTLRTVHVPGFGSYRIIAFTAQLYATGEWVTVVRGLPMTEVDTTMSNLIRWSALLTLLGVGIAGGGAMLLVQQQLRPLREVAATAHTVAGLPLATGDVGEIEGVPARLTDERNEVGRVGAALNMLLAHVQSSLAARHRSEQQVRQFVADASHELRTPLTTIAGYTELARRHPGESELALKKVEEESARMTSMVEDLLLLARLDSGRPLEREPVDLSRLLIEAVSDARVVDPERQWQLVAESADPVTVWGDAQRLHQVVTNLLTNATRYTSAGTTVTVRVTDDGFAVHDDGPGFPPSLQKRAFERFVRGDESRHGGGTGLGLALVHAIVSAHGGTVSLTSRPGDTTITVALPRTSYESRSE